MKRRFINIVKSLLFNIITIIYYAHAYFNKVTSGIINVNHQKNEIQFQMYDLKTNIALHNEIKYSDFPLKIPKYII